MNLDQDRAKFTTQLHRLSKRLGLPGMSVAVVKDGEIIYRHLEGFADLASQEPMSAGTLVGIASVTKSFTGTMLMQMSREGKISLNDLLLKFPLNTSWHSPASIGDPNIIIKDVASMTSGDRPGETYFYNGARFNLLSGIFDAVSADSSPQSYVRQVRNRILDPVQMTSTVTGYPSEPSILKPLIAKRYQAVTHRGGWEYKELPYDWDAAYPASGLISTIDDLAKYAFALDNASLLSSDEYLHMTTRTVDAKGRQHPYALRWFSQNFEGAKLDWVFGFGQAESAVLLRVPSKRLTFIFLANADSPSAVSMLDYGDVQSSPFALAFLREFLAKDSAPPVDLDKPAKVVESEMTATKNSPIVAEELLNEALLETYVASRTLTSFDQSVSLTQLFWKKFPHRFEQNDVYILYLLSEIYTPALKAPAETLLRTFDLSWDKRPVVAYWMAHLFEKMGERSKAIHCYHLLADRPGFDDESFKAKACESLFEFYRETGEVKKAKTYLWQSALISSAANDSGEFARKVARLAGP